jgi:hypothetical protein
MIRYGSIKDDWLKSLNARKSILFLIALLFTGSFVADAQTSLLVVPRRVLFEGSGRRTKELNLANSGKDTGRYTISVINLRMKEDGAFEEIAEADSGQNFASSHLRIFPRNIVLGPDEAQAIRVQLINTTKMAPGEYRSHIYFKAVPKERTDKKPLKKMKTNLKLSLKPMFGVTIPVIIRIGENTTRVEITDLSFQIVNGRPVLSGLFNRTGNMSSYGDFFVEHISPKGEKMQVGFIKGFSLFAPNTKRKFSMYLNKDVNVDFKSGKLKIAYFVPVEERSVKACEAELTLK